MTNKQRDHLLLSVAQLLVSQYPEGDNYPAAWAVYEIREAIIEAERGNECLLGPGGEFMEGYNEAILDAATAIRASNAAGECRMTNRTRIITLCGSTRFPEAFELVNMHLSLQGHIVISLGCMGHSDKPTGAKFLTSDGNEDSTIKQNLDQLHFRKIDQSDGIFVVNVGGYIGSSTKREIAYALANGKDVEYLFQKDSGAVP